MRVFKTRWFAKFVQKEKIGAVRLLEAVARAGRGSIDADLGKGLVKQRVARQGGGRSGGYRTIFAFRSDSRAVFLYGFGKNERDNISSSDLDRLREAAAEYLALAWRDIDEALNSGKLTEIENE